MQLPAVPGERRFGVVCGCAGRQNEGKKTNVGDGSVSNTRGTGESHLTIIATARRISGRVR